MASATTLGGSDLEELYDFNHAVYIDMTTPGYCLTLKKKQISRMVLGLEAVYKSLIGVSGIENPVSRV